MRIEFQKKGVNGTKFRYQVVKDGKAHGTMNVNVNVTYQNVCILSIDREALKTEVLRAFAGACGKTMTVYIKLHPLELEKDVEKLLTEVPEDEIYRTEWTRSSSAQKIYKIKA